MYETHVEFYFSDRNHFRNSGDTLLYNLALNIGNLDTSELNSENVVDKNPADNFGNTPLHYAANYGCLEICRLIIDNVDNPHTVNNARQTPKALANLNGHIAVSQLFQN